MRTNTRAAGIGGVLMALTLSLPAFAATSVATDPAGDVLFKAPGYMDIVRAELAADSGTFFFRMTVAAAIPNNPPVAPPANASIRWAFPIDSDPATFPEGDPFPRNQPGPSEFNTGVRGLWADRAPGKAPFAYGQGGMEGEPVASGRGLRNV